eukprot:7360627-Prymnesium_polylepis.1
MPRARQAAVHGTDGRVRGKAPFSHKRRSARAKRKANLLLGAGEPSRRGQSVSKVAGRASP